MRCWRATNEKGLTPHLTTGTQTRYDLFSHCHTFALYIYREHYAMVDMFNPSVSCDIEAIFIKSL